MPVKHPFQVNAEGYLLKPAPGGRWHLVSPSGHTYTVDPLAGTCTCPDFHARGHKRVCKHVEGIWALLKLVPDLVANITHQ